MREALASKLFVALSEKGILNEDHAGGCILFEKRQQVEQLVDFKFGTSTIMETIEDGIFNKRHN